MRLLIDTHALIWYVDQDHLLSPAGHAAISDPSNDLLLSGVSIWEIAIKVSLKKLVLSLTYRAWIEQAIDDLSLTVLQITLDHADALLRLPFHHRGPFDRLIAAQAQVEGVPLVSADSGFDHYGVTRVW
jgi:PIN domain nuclease of toxin-antitoxin system